MNEKGKTDNLFSEETDEKMAEQAEKAHKAGREWRKAGMPGLKEPPGGSPFMWIDDETIELNTINNIGGTMNPIHNIIVNAVNEEVHTAIREHIREHKTFQSVLHLMVHNELNELVVAIGRVNNPDKTAEYWDKEREQMDNESTAEVMNKYDLDD